MMAGRSIRLACVALVTLFAAISAFGPCLAWQATPAAAGVVESDTTLTADFPRGLQFESTLRFDDDIEPANVTLLYRPAGRETFTAAFVDDIATLDDETIRVATFLDFQSDFMPSGLTLEYRWQLEPASGLPLSSTLQQIDWIDDRFAWESLSSAQVDLRFYGQDEGFAQQILSAAQSTIDSLEERFGLAESRPLRIWIYPNGSDFAASMQPNSRESVAGLSYPGYFVAAAVIPPESHGEIGRVIPHEVAHLVLHEATLNPFTTMPLWFDEGMATNVQLGGTDGYPAMVRAALDRGTLFELASLNMSFPFQPAQATLAYASSYSVVQFIEATWGDDGIARLVDAFSAGSSIDAAIEVALGVSLNELDDAWKAWIGSTGAVTPFRLAA